MLFRGHIPAILLGALLAFGIAVSPSHSSENSNLTDLVFAVLDEQDISRPVLADALTEAITTNFDSHLKLLQRWSGPLEVVIFSFVEPSERLAIEMGLEEVQALYPIVLVDYEGNPEGVRPLMRSVSPRVFIFRGDPSTYPMEAENELLLGRAPAAYLPTQPNGEINRGLDIAVSRMLDAQRAGLDPNESRNCALSVLYDLGDVVHVFGFINMESSFEFQSKCFFAITLSALGMSLNVPGSIESVTNSDSDAFAPTKFDLLAVRLLLDDRLESGLTYEEVRIRIDDILVEAE